MKFEMVLTCCTEQRSNPRLEVVVHCALKTTVDNVGEVLPESKGKLDKKQEYLISTFISYQERCSKTRLLYDEI